MKKSFLFLVAALTLSAGALSAQNCMVVDSEKVFKSIAAYNTAISQIDADAEKYQKQIDDSFAQLETTFNDYKNRKASMTAAQRQQTEQNIVAREEQITKFQEDTFGEDGTLAKKRETLLKPIQDRVTAAIQKYAAGQGFDIVLEASSTLYFKPASDRTNAIINLVK